MRYIAAAIFLFFVFPSYSYARPVSFPGGWTVMSRNNWELNRLHFHYSPSKDYSIGLASEYLRRDEEKRFNLQLNRLLFRKNRARSQANVYLKSQGGIALRGDDLEPNFHVAIAGDWETRRYFISYEVAGQYARDFDRGSFHQIARTGVAPYIGDYGSLHTWLMIQYEHHPEEEDQYRVGPLLRVFKSDYLAEFGVDNQSELTFNLVIRY